MRTEKWLGDQVARNWTRVRRFSFEHCGSPGVPDFYCVAPGAIPFWIELKVVSSVERLIPFRTGQPQWLDEHALAGGRAFVLVWVETPKTLVLLRAERVRILSRLKLASAGAWKIAEGGVSAPDTWETLEDMCLGHPRHKKQQSWNPPK